MIRLAARAGMVGPILFASVLSMLTILKYDFLLSLGWHPLNAPTFDWPSGLALGQYGWIMTATFLLSGFMMILFASGLHLSLPRTRLAFLSTFTLSLSGLALAGLAFTTDPTIRSTPTTWHGRLHDLSFVLLGITLMPAMILLGFAFRKDAHWQKLSLYTWSTVALAFPVFWHKGAAFYIFMLAVLAWIEVAAIRLGSSIKVDFVEVILYSIVIKSKARRVDMAENQIVELADESAKLDPNSYFKEDFTLLPPPLRRAAYSDRTAFVMASMAHLAYSHFEDGGETKETFETILKSGGFTLIATFNSKETDTQAFLVKNDEYAVLAFRGTEVSKKTDIATDAKALKVKATEGGIHRGFAGAYTSIMKDIKAELEKLPGLPIYITGHSLGAALATVATQYLEKDVIEESKAPLRDQIAACYTFGSPRVGDELFKEKLKSPVYRVVNTTDIVTVVPLLAMGYTHVGDVRFLGPQEGSIQGGIPFFRRTFFFLASVLRLFTSLVGDHAIVKYRAKLALVAMGRNEELFKNARSGGKF